MIRAIFAGFVVGGMLASGSVAVAAQTWTWFVDAEGSASGSLGALLPLDVSDARGGDGLLPGETMALKVDIDSPNRVALTLVSVEIGDLESGDDACDGSLADSRLRFSRSPGILIRPGQNAGIILGTVRLPRLLAQDCQGEDITATVSVRAAYGAEG